MSKLMIDIIKNRWQEYDGKNWIFLSREDFSKRYPNHSELELDYCYVSGIFPSAIVSSKKDEEYFKLLFSAITETVDSWTEEQIDEMDEEKKKTIARIKEITFRKNEG